MSPSHGKHLPVRLSFLAGNSFIVQWTPGDSRWRIRDQAATEDKLRDANELQHAVLVPCPFFFILRNLVLSLTSTEGESCEARRMSKKMSEKTHEENIRKDGELLTEAKFRKIRWRNLKQKKKSAVHVRR
jgi:hypothetical protein